MKSAMLLVLMFSCCFPSKVIGGELQDRLIPVPYSKNATDQAIRVVNAFRSNLDNRNNPSSSSTSLHKRSSTLSGLSSVPGSKINSPDEPGNEPSCSSPKNPEADTPGPTVETTV